MRDLTIEPPLLKIRKLIRRAGTCKIRVNESITGAVSLENTVLENRWQGSLGGGKFYIFP